MTQRRGYILLTVLLLLMLAAVAMASFCRLAIQQSLQASTADNELQRRWGTISCRDVLLLNAENILETDETSLVPITRVHADFLLGDEKFSVDICDEQSKANVNALFAINGKDRAEQSVAMLTKSAGNSWKPRLRALDEANVRSPSKSKPADDNAESQSTGQFLTVFGSWSEIFPGIGTADLWPSQPNAVSNNVTCWGNGALNIHRAPAACISQMCGPTLSPQQIAKLVVLRSRLGDNASVDDLLTAAQIGTADALNVAGRLTSTSAVHSLWIRSQDHSASQNSLTIRDGSNSDDVRTFSFQW